jgi:hypothetical protein
VDLTAIGLWLANILFGVILGRPRPGVRIDTSHGVGIYISGGGGFHAYDADLLIHAAGRATFTVREAGWIFADGHEIAAELPTEGRTLSLGGPELRGSSSASTIAKEMRERRGLVQVYVTIVGRDKRFTFPATNEWRVRITEADRKSGAH